MTLNERAQVVHKATVETEVSKFVQEKCDEETNYLFQERSGMCMDSGLSIEDADREAHKQIFGVDWIAGGKQF